MEKLIDMTKKHLAILLAILCVTFSVPCLNAHDYQVSLIADTDMALDDARTLIMLLNSDTANIKLIVSSDGAASPQAGVGNISRLLNCFNKKDIPVGIGSVSDKPAPPWRTWSENLTLPESASTASESHTMSASETILKTLNAVDGELIYLCLGPLTNLADALRSDPGIKKKISSLVFFGGMPGDADPGWNYKRDSESADFVFKSGLNIYSLHIPDEKLLLFDQKFFDRITAMNTPAARMVTALHKSPAVSKLLSEGHFRVWDEMTAIYLHYPSLFKFAPAKISGVMQIADFKSDQIQEVYLRLLSPSSDAHLDARESVVLNHFPADPSLFRDDVSPYVEKIIQRHGLEEWKACVLTNEFHRHLGIYSIVGAKMGIRAREILEAPFDTLEVISLAGDKPPLSCMNDGLQVSTGASLGRGAIRLSDEKSQPASIFNYKNQSLTLRIKSEILEKIKSDIDTAVKTYGGMNAEYFEHIRKLSVRYWYEFDRKEIFEKVMTEKE